MLPINNSDLAWPIVADYNQENDIGFPKDLREDILNPEVNLFSGTNLIRSVGDGEGEVGSEMNDEPSVGSFHGSSVGCTYDARSWISRLVGAHDDDEPY